MATFLFLLPQRKFLKNQIYTLGIFQNCFFPLFICPSGTGSVSSQSDEGELLDAGVSEGSLQRDPASFECFPASLGQYYHLYFPTGVLLQHVPLQVGWSWMWLSVFACLSRDFRSSAFWILYFLRSPGKVDFEFVQDFFSFHTDRNDDNQASNMLSLKPEVLNLYFKISNTFSNLKIIFSKRLLTFQWTIYLARVTHSWLFSSFWISDLYIFKVLTKNFFSKKY